MRQGRAIGILVAVAAVALVGSVFSLLTPALPALPSWTPPVVVELPSIKTLSGQVVANHMCGAPRNVAADAAGRVYTVCRDGDVEMLAGNASTYSTFPAKAGGAFGLTFGPLGGLIIAGGSTGLLHVGGRPEPTVLLSTQASDDAGLRFVAGVDDFKLTPEVLFISATDQAHRAQPANALLAHAGRGGLYRYDLRSKQSQRLMDGLQAPLAVAIGPDDAYAIVAETGAYRLLRFWLKGDRAGTTEVFADQLPGFVTSVSFNGSGRIWAALAVPRSKVFDLLTPHPALRGLLARLQWSWLPMSDRSRAVAFDLDGHVVDAFQLKHDSGIGRMTSIVEHGPWLWIGSDQASAIVRVPLQSLIATAPPPPLGWQNAPHEARVQTIKVEQDDD